MQICSGGRWFCWALRCLALIKRNVLSILFFFLFALLSLQNKNISFLLIDINNGEQSSGKDLGLRIDIFDEVGIGGGASGVSGGLLHPYSPKGTITYQSSSLHSTLCSFVITFFFHSIYLYCSFCCSLVTICSMIFIFSTMLMQSFRQKAYILSKIKNFG